MNFFNILFSYLFKILVLLAIMVGLWDIIKEYNVNIIQNIDMLLKYVGYSILK